MSRVASWVTVLVVASTIGSVVAFGLAGSEDRLLASLIASAVGAVTVVAVESARRGHRAASLAALLPALIGTAFGVMSATLFLVPAVLLAAITVLALAVRPVASKPTPTSL
jgi:hypothetical protein